MKKNVGNTDRIIRIAIGLAIGAAGIWFESYWGLLGLIPIITAFIRFCPLYCPLGLDTGCKK
ncbi:MAG: hypothetical protein A2X11_12650 [Bacteroidetes bacterium GWE2_42_24]|nr:MAG: hypothetical protein A2X11_12650 [Bacteroidetes bacterium GWE2_42_24]OFY30646.1 MAG: hypothetical protein A2X09_03900 [Bacteroidetes bacterium GWF2_43_11]